MSFLSRFPARRQIMPVFALTALLVYGWTIYRMLQKLPSWLLYLTGYEIASSFSYALVFDFLECLLIVGWMMGLAGILPRRVFAEHFVCRGAALSLLGLSYLIYLAQRVGQSKANVFPWGAFAWSPLAFAGILLAVFLVLPRLRGICAFLEDLADRAIIFLYIFLPLTLVGLVILLVNNLT